jgi:NMD protein affecting ribosome stability and mRNA decay
VDRSGDPTVSFQTPTRLSPEQAALAVVAHENEHVSHERQNAEQNGQIAHSTVSISYAVCPECGRIYVSGGTTKTTISIPQKNADYENAEIGRVLDLFV